jgi:hypothetical protein
MTFEIPKDMKFEQIHPRKGSGSVSAFRKTVRCGIYIWHETNVRLATVIGCEVAKLAGLKPQDPVEVQVGVSNDVVIATYKKGMDENVAYYTAKANGKVNFPRPNSDLRLMSTLDKHLIDYFIDEKTKYVICEHMVRDRSIIVRMHQDLLNGNPQMELPL